MSFERFLEEGRALLAKAEAALDGAPAEAAPPVMAFGLDAAVLDMPEVANLAAAWVGEAERPDADGPALRGGLEALRATLDELGDADRSGAHYDAERLEAARERLASRAPGPARPAAPPPPPAKPASESAWQPTVDEDMIDPFLEECHDRLESLSTQLLELEARPDDPELVKAVFRDLHTLKGSAGFVGLTKMARVAHAAEDLVGLVREGRRSADRAVVDALLACLDVLQAIVQRAADRASIDVDVEPLLARPRDPGAATPARSSQPAAAPSPIEAPATRVQQTLRIEFTKLDELMNLVGELVLSKGRVGSGLEDLHSLARELEHQRRGARGRAGRRARRGAVRFEDLATELGRLQRAFDSLHGEMEGAQQQLELVSGQLRDQVMKLRMLPVGRSWSKYHRTVRQIAQRLGKEVVLELSGEETELDKVLVEQLDEPLLHLVRNAVDHGIERPDEREAAGKPRAGTLSLSAFHRGNQIVVRLSDDGKGIDPERVREKAVRSGLVSAEAAAELDAEQVIDLIFHAGFSTREQVSDLSGRGVGMDVVRETLARLKGTVHVSSTLGQGTVFELRLPLTLAIVQVLLLRSAGQTFALPLDLVRRTLAVAPETLRLTGQQETLLEDGREIPLIRLDQLLRLPGAATEVPREAPVVLVEVGHQLVGLVCDAFLGRKEIVLKTLGSLLKRVPGAAGATLVGDRPAVILDVPALVSLAMTETPQAPRPEGVEGQAVGESEAPRGKARILVVEDTDVIRETLRRTLTRAGYEVVVARDGAEGLERARAERFDLVSTDVVMPGLDGYELTRRLRRLEGYRDVPILMVTSKAERIDRLRGFDAGVDAYLTKPTDAAELLRAIDEHLVSARFAR